MCIDDSLSYQQICRLDSCNKSGAQCVDISLPIEVAPLATVGEITSTCQGAPVVTCETDAAHNVCVVTMTQEVCLNIPVSYGVATTAGSASIACASGAGASGSCGCSVRGLM